MNVRSHMNDEDEGVAIAFDLMEWAEIMAALNTYKYTLDISKATNSFFDVIRIMKKINDTITGAGK